MAQRLPLRAHVPRRPLDFFQALEKAVTQDVPGAPWNPPPDSTQPYQEFLERLRAMRPALERQHSPDWTVVLLMDELDTAAASLPDDECFQNLRNLLSVSDLRRHFRAVCTGVAQDLIKHGSPLNILDPAYTRLLSDGEAGQLFRAGFPQGLAPKIEQSIRGYAGGHPYILQGLLMSYWRHRDEPDPLRQATRTFLRERSATFRTWRRDMGADGRAVFRKLAEAEAGTVPAQALRAALASAGSLDETLQRLAFHGVIAEEDSGSPRVASELFQRWFRDFGADPETAPEPAAAPPPAPGPRLPAAGEEIAGRDPANVFVVHGRNLRVHAALCAFLRSLGLKPLEWSEMVEATGDATPYVGKVLETGFRKASAVVVLFTPDDVAWLSEPLRSPHDPEYESQPTPQPRANVLFEAGMAMALFPKQTVLVQVGKMRPLSDLGGLHVLRMDGSFPVREGLAKRLRAAGCPVKMETTAWHTAGDFTV